MQMQVTEHVNVEKPEDLTELNDDDIVDVPTFEGKTKVYILYQKSISHLELWIWDTETKIAGFKNFYEDYKNHLPNTSGIKLNKIKGLRDSCSQLAVKVYEQLSKVVVVKRAGVDSYQLIPQGFLSVFRGRSGQAGAGGGGGWGKGARGAGIRPYGWRVSGP